MQTQILRLVSRINPQTKTFRSIADLVTFMFERDLNEYILVLSDDKGDRVVVLPSTDPALIYKALGATLPVVKAVEEVKPAAPVKTTEADKK